ncbi:twin-arginine translocase subunit TatB [Mangrovimicrobium sediminis]|uniref:Sec-independent protein translocase protein TatB n=1 Tax=Mangrovimicrobium sediminis TaxID=2562682 RepID=A0A4Z0M0U7_9GAMM|nr:Sec-independent protein translocase protein TatB [Haliea sp. SAOS-164]TGD73044.1 twin-arginine translocase subunit TatB [Haliea sp. SAOS-164]
MFDIGFSELIIVGVVGLLVIGPERLPEAIRTGSAWLARIKRGFNDIKIEVQQELHNDAVMRDLEKTRRQLEQQAGEIKNSIDPGVSAPKPADPGTSPAEAASPDPADSHPGDSNSPSDGTVANTGSADRSRGESR